MSSTHLASFTKGSRLITQFQIGLVLSRKYNAPQAALIWVHFPKVGQVEKLKQYGQQQQSSQK